MRSRRRCIAGRMPRSDEQASGGQYKPRRQIRDDAVYVRSRQMLATTQLAANPIDYTPIVQREGEPEA